MDNNILYEQIEKALNKRAKRRSINISLEKMRYANSLYYGSIDRSKLNRVLFVGIGHGHNAILALLDDHIGSAVGVDPYIASHGNDNEDMNYLMELIEDYSLSKRLILVKSSIEDYINITNETFDAIICEDVLHHIFECPILLRKSDMIFSSIGLFKSFWEKTNRNGALLISELNRYGLRPVLKKIGIIGGNINYNTKQPWQEWARAASKANWRLHNVKNYVPYALRKKTSALSGPIGRYTACHRYHLSFLK